MAKPVSEQEFFAISERAEQIGLRVEISGGLPIWELMPSPIHMLDAEAISETIRPTQAALHAGCGCHHVQDMAIRFPDGSIRRPDIAIYCVRPPRTRQASTVIPTAAVEILSPSSEVKDIEVSPPFYLAHGVKDVFVYDPEGLIVRHYRSGSASTHLVPVEFETESGCVIGFPSPPSDPQD